MPIHMTAIEVAAKKAGVKPSQIVAKGKNDKPARDAVGLFLRLSAKTGKAVWAYWNGAAFGLYSDSKKGAMDRRHKLSKKKLPWFGFYKKN